MFEFFLSDYCGMVSVFIDKYLTGTVCIEIDDRDCSCPHAACMQQDTSSRAFFMYDRRKRQRYLACNPSARHFVSARASRQVAGCHALLVPVMLENDRQTDRHTDRHSLPLSHLLPTTYATGTVHSRE